MIDLHLHTTASDGLLAPDVLMARAAAAGLTVVSVTDHDTVAALACARAAAEGLGLRFVDGIEMTAIEDGADVHILGYFLDVASPTLTRLIAAQRRNRARRVERIAERLRELGIGIDVAPLLARAEAGGSVGRPAIADALIAAGAVASREDAFARLLGRGGPAFVPRQGPRSVEVIEALHEAGGLASLAHPGVLGRDDFIPVLAEAGLDAVEVWHSDHTPALRTRYAAMADRLGLARTGGSDFHGDGVHRAAALGLVEMPADEFARLAALAADRS